MAARLRQFAFVRTASSAVIAAFALAAGADSAYATCGDYLSHGLTRASKPGSSMTLPLDGDSHSPVCRDGSCHHSIPRDVPPPPQTRVGGDHWACPASQDFTAEPPSVVIGDARELSPLAPFRAGLFRPPRAC